MDLSPLVLQSIEEGDFDTIEDAWLARMAEDPGDIERFAAVARAVTAAGEEERARFLLEMLDGELREHGRWEIRLDLLRRAANMLLPPEAVHPAILDTLRALHGESPSFEGFVRAVRLDKAPHDIPKSWEKVARLRELMHYDVGTAVWMEGKGAGRVVEVNLELDSLKVDLGGAVPLTVGFRAAPKMLHALPPGHLLRLKLEDSEGLRRLAADDPSELLRLTLVSFDRPLTAGEVRDHLSGLVPAAKWTSWWATARKHPQVVARGSGRQTYAWLGSQEDAVDAVWERFGAADGRRKLALLRKEGGREAALTERMGEVLAGEALAVAEDEPGLAFEIAWTLERVGATVPDEVDPRRLVRDTDDPGHLLAGIEDRLAREQALDLAREERADWVAVYAARMGREEEARTLDRIADALGAEAPQEIVRQADALLSQPHKHPAGFVWLIERAAEDPALRERSTLRFLQQILNALGDRTFLSFRPRLAGQVESGGTLPRLLDHLEPRQAPQAEEVLHRAAFLESYQRDAMVNALHLRFPDLRGEPEIDVIYSTPEAIEARRKELERLVREEIPANRKAIEEARAMGDLRENFEYKSARQRHELLSARQGKLEHELSLARPIDVGRLETTEVRIGCRVELAAADGATRTITILGPWDSKPEEDILAYETDLAKVLLGKAVGDPVEAAGVAYEVRAIGPFTE